MPKIVENLEKRLIEEARKQIEEVGYDHPLWPACKVLVSGSL